MPLHFLVLHIRPEKCLFLINCQAKLFRSNVSVLWRPCEVNQPQSIQLNSRSYLSAVEAIQVLL